MFKRNSTEDLNRAITTGTSIIAEGMVLTGDLVSQHALRVDGEICGNINCAEKLIVGSQGFVNGDVVSKEVILMGRIKGDIRASESLVLKGKARLDGNVKTRMLSVEPEAVFNGCCNMDAEEPIKIAEKVKTRIKEKNFAVETTN